MRKALCGVVVLALASASQAVVVPNSAETTSGGGSFLGPLSNAQRTYQLLVDDTQLSGVVGHQITGITWRLLPSATAAYPAADQSFANFDIRLSEGVEPSARSLTFANNVQGVQTLVRSGPLNVPAGSFPVGSNPQPFGLVVNFDTPYTYTGGNLLLEFRHSGITGSSASVDAVTASGGPGNGYGTLFSAAWSSNATATTGSQGNAVVTNFLTIVPEPGALAILSLAVAPMLRRRK
jgi:hypothetical protein